MAAEELKIPFANTYIDTVALSRYLNPELKNHKLDTLAKYFLLGDFNHHRACDDAYILGLIFRKMTEKLHGEGVFDTAGMVKSMADKCDPSKLKTYHMIMLVENLEFCFDFHHRTAIIGHKLDKAARFLQNGI